MKTYSTKASEVRRSWHVLDAKGVPLGRLASQAAALIRGKHKVIYAPHLDTGDFVVVVNAAEVALTGRKEAQKRYYRHSQYPGGLKVRTVREEMERNPTRVVEHAVLGMLPHNRLGRALHGHLKVYGGAEHPHAAQVNGPAQPLLSQPPPPGRRKNGAEARRTVAGAIAAARAGVLSRPSETEAAVPAAEEPAIEPVGAESASEETEETGA
jgi:large subunit ribosomal protein L13